MRREGFEMTVSPPKVIFKEDKNKNDRTISFWEEGKGEWDSIICGSWKNANFISERIKQPKSPLSRGDAKFMMQFWFTAKFGKRAQLAKTLIDNDLVEGAVNSMIGTFPAGDLVVSNAMKSLDEISGILEMGEKYSSLMKELEPLVSNSSRHLSMLVFD